MNGNAITAFFYQFFIGHSGSATNVQRCPKTGQRSQVFLLYVDQYIDLGCSQEGGMSLDLLQLLGSENVLKDVLDHLYRGVRIHAQMYSPTGSGPMPP